MDAVEQYLEGRVTLHRGDCLNVLKTLPDASIDSCVTDPPYALVSIGRRFGKVGASPARVPEGRSGAYARASCGFMGKSWDTGERAFAAEMWAEVWRVLKPGGHVLAFGGTRSYHRLACAIEDAGFEIRDQIGWAYGSGFPKSHDVAKGIDRAAGVTREVIGVHRSNKGDSGGLTYAALGEFQQSRFTDVTAPATEGARRWAGWGTALKPAWEPIAVGRKALIGTVAENVLAHGTGAINIDGCRVGSDVVGWGGARGGSEDDSQSQGRNYRLGAGSPRPVEGRHPANIVHDGSDEVIAAFPQSDGQQGDVRGTERSQPFGGHIFGEMTGRHSATKRGDSGSAARFFYSAKADADDRLGSKHPTVKPVDLMQWLVRLVTPPGGLVLDPFAGTGTTGEAAWREGMRAVLIEREAEYQADIVRRMSFARSSSDQRKKAALEAKGGSWPKGEPFALDIFDEVRP